MGTKTVWDHWNAFKDEGRFMCVESCRLLLVTDDNSSTYIARSFSLTGKMLWRQSQAVKVVVQVE